MLAGKAVFTCGSKDVFVTTSMISNHSLQIIYRRVCWWSFFCRLVWCIGFMLIIIIIINSNYGFISRALEKWQKFSTNGIHITSKVFQYGIFCSVSFDIRKKYEDVTQKSPELVWLRENIEWKTPYSNFFLMWCQASNYYGLNLHLLSFLLSKKVISRSCCLFGSFHVVHVNVLITNIPTI